jgi:uncharacterized protein (DUF305 family)
MTRNRWIAAIAAIVVVAAGAIGIAMAVGGDHDDMDGHSGRVAHDGATMQMGADGMMTMDARAFIEMMIPHHRSAVDMARIQIARGTDPQATALARRIVADQEREIGQMRRWYRDWYGTDVPELSRDAMAAMGMHSGTGNLEDTDDPDREFLRLMIPHHASAVTMADMVLNGEPREEIAGLARRIIAAQATEIGQMQRMRERIAPPIG